MRSLGGVRQISSVVAHCPCKDSRPASQLSRDQTSASAGRRGGGEAKVYCDTSAPTPPAPTPSLPMRPSHGSRQHGQVGVARGCVGPASPPRARPSPGSGVGAGAVGPAHATLCCTFRHGVWSRGERTPFAVASQLRRHAPALLVALGLVKRWAMVVAALASKLGTHFLGPTLVVLGIVVGPPPLVRRLLHTQHSVQSCPL